ncbi:P-type conjugative transfer protein TrbL [Legionella qingyii]|uniref:P-type conjugative transfer protein TrbL n=1 Tax=Legionella qingyii TaxID=2184757 RepID=A0A317U277_9GAMM|nr:P-type conjugative transfer protein TrbL [Legionella qingyii]PWY54592.1 P-type conjugative transfer protein TrbL [Legionella qingyii]PWY55508.1 P-type conjugative transfer protein TrbL [Legionella qingyii]RUR21484.1 P-type conjugative transfer protein TrbL [Legionella qingyii]
MKKKTITYLIVFLLIGFSLSAHAQGSMDSRDLLDNILYRFSSTASTWSQTILSYARYLFWSLALISMVWTYGLMSLRRADIQEFMAETVRFLVVVGFFYWILDNGPAIATAIIDSMRQLAAKASGIDTHISPSDIIDVGFDIVSKAINNSSLWSPAATTVGLIVAGVILVVLALVSINMLIILITAWILTYGGIILLGFGGGRWTCDIAIQYYKTVLGIALQAFAMILIIGIGKSFVDQYYAAMAKDILLKEMFVMLVVSIILLILINKIPPVLASIVSGGGGGSGGIGLGGALGAAGVAGAALASSAGAVSAQSAGGLSALHAAFKAASQSMGAGDLGSVSEGNVSSKTGSLAQAMGQASKFAGSFGSHLASGTFDVAREKASAMKEAMAATVAETTGGKIADAIHQRVESQNDLSASEHQDSAFQNITSIGTPEGSFSAGENDDEVSHFVNRKASGDCQ